MLCSLPRVYDQVRFELDDDGAHMHVYRLGLGGLTSLRTRLTPGYGAVVTNGGSYNVLRYGGECQVVEAPRTDAAASSPPGAAEPALSVMLGEYTAAHGGSAADAAGGRKHAAATPAAVAVPGGIPRGHGSGSGGRARSVARNGEGMQPPVQTNEALDAGVWPDPDLVPTDGSCRNELRVDDVSRMNATRVERLWYVRSRDDVRFVLEQARRQQRSVSVRGTQHSMVSVRARSFWCASRNSAQPGRVL